MSLSHHRSHPVRRPFLVLVLLLVAAFTCQSAMAQTSGRVPGQYQVVNLAPSALEVPQALKPHSLDVATLDIYESFQCPHCQNFYPKQAILKKVYGRKLVIRNHYLALNEARLNADLRLYILAKEKGMGREVADSLMRAGLNEANPAQVRRATGAVAKRYGLFKEYQKSLSDASFAGKVHALDSQASFIRQSPTLILNDQLQFGGNLQNIMTILDGVLIAPPKS